MDKLTKYNQKLLAILGTLLVVALTIILLGAGIFFIIDQVEDAKRNHARDNALVLENATQTNDSTENQPVIRKQEISFDSPRLIDTLKALYLVPISQVNLKNPELIESNEDMEPSPSYSGRKFAYHRYSGLYNNILVYHHKENSKVAVFDRKISIHAFENWVVSNRHYLFIEGVTNDSNKDKKLNHEDLQSFFIYDIEDHKLQEIQIDGYGLVDYYVIHESEDIILRFGKDKDQNGELDEYQEPIVLKRYNISSASITDFIDKDLLKKMQQLID